MDPVDPVDPADPADPADSVDLVDYAEKYRQGLRPINPPAEHRDEQGKLIRKVLYAQDPDGNWLEFVELL